MWYKKGPHFSVPGEVSPPRKVCALAAALVSLRPPSGTVFCEARKKNDRGGVCAPRAHCVATTNAAPKKKTPPFPGVPPRPQGPAPRAHRVVNSPYGPLGLCRTPYWRRIASRSHRTVSRIASWSYIEHAYPGLRSAFVPKAVATLLMMTTNLNSGICSISSGTAGYIHSPCARPKRQPRAHSRWYRRYVPSGTESASCAASSLVAPRYS